MSFVFEPGVTLGPLLMGPVIQVLLQGVLFDMTWQYLTNARGEHRAVVGIVVFLTLVALVQTGASMWELWITFVTGFGKLAQALAFHWPQKLQTVWQASMAAPVQGYYIWRCFRVTHKNYFVLVPLSALLASSWAVAAHTTWVVFQIDFGTSPDLPACTLSSIAEVPRSIAHVIQRRDEPLPLDALYIYYLVSSAALDLFVTAILTVTLWRSKSPIVGGHLNNVLTKLIRGAWQTAFPPAACALATMITYLALINSSGRNLDLFFQQIMGKLYVISLLITLNTRIEMRNHRTASYEMRPSTGNKHTSVRIEFRTETVVDSVDGTRHHRVVGSDAGTGTTANNRRPRGEQASDLQLDHDDLDLDLDDLSLKGTSVVFPTETVTHQHSPRRIRDVESNTPPTFNPDYKTWM